MAKASDAATATVVVSTWLLFESASTSFRYPAGGLGGGEGGGRGRGGGDGGGASGGGEGGRGEGGGGDGARSVWVAMNGVATTSTLTPRAADMSSTLPAQKLWTSLTNAFAVASHSSP